MNHPTPHVSRIEAVPFAATRLLSTSLSVAITAAIFSGCEAYQKADQSRPLSHIPEVRSITVPLPIVAQGSGLLGPTTITLPPGEYLPLKEDSVGAYYFSPSGVQVDDASHLPFPHSGGGIYLQTRPEVKAIAFLKRRNSPSPWLQRPDLPISLAKMKLNRTGAPKLKEEPIMW